jgi:hypothetical protein
MWNKRGRPSSPIATPISKAPHGYRPTRGPRPPSIRRAGSRRFPARAMAMNSPTVNARAHGRRAPGLHAPLPAPPRSRRSAGMTPCGRGSTPTLINPHRKHPAAAGRKSSVIHWFTDRRNRPAFRSILPQGNAEPGQDFNDRLPCRRKPGCGRLPPAVFIEEYLRPGIASTTVFFAPAQDLSTRR